MPFHFEALVGYLYVVGGRAVSVSPPGALVEVAPTRAARGREADTFFALVLPSGDSIAPTAFYGQMANLSAERYFDSTGSVSAGLRDMMTTLNQNLLDHNQSANNRTYEANMVCAVLRGDDLIIARVGSGVVMLLHEGQTQTLPVDLSNDEALYAPPLGVKSLPEVKLSRHKIANGSRLLLADSNMADFKREQLDRAISLADIAEVLVGFKELARLQLTLVAVEFVPPEVPAPIPVPEGESTLAIAEAARAVASKTRTGEMVAVGDSPSGSTGIRRPNRRASAATLQVAQTAQQGLSVAAQGAARGMTVTSRAVEHFFGPPPEGKRRWYASPVATAVAILIPIVIVGVVVTLWLEGTGQSEYEICLETAQSLKVSAEAVPSDNVATTLTHWNAVINKSRECELMRPNDPDSLAMIREGQEIIDFIDQVKRRDARLMDTVEDAVFSQIVLRLPNIYVLDKTSRKRVYYGGPSDDGLSMDRRLNPIADMTTGATVDGYTIGDLVGIAYNDGNDSIYVLDVNGVLVRCSRIQMQECEALLLRDIEQWVRPVAIQFWGTSNRLYVLDPGANQIWRYEASGSGGYDFNPTAYFAGQNIGSITQAIDFAIDRPPGGNVYVLLADGTLLMYNQGEPQELRYGAFPEGQPLESAQALILDDSTLVNAFFIANRDRQIIYEVAKGGTFRNAYKVFDDRLLATLGGIASNSTLEILYATSGNALMAIQRRE